MKKAVFLLLCLLNVLVSYGQEIQRKLYTEKDGYRWYYVYGGVFGIQNIDGTYVYYSDDNRYEYSTYYTNFDTYSNRSFFWIKRKNKKIIPKKRKERKKYVYVDSTCVAMVKLNGEIVIPFERGYTNATYMTLINRNFFSVEKRGKEGVCDIHGNEIVEPKYASVYYSLDGFYGKKESFGYDYKKLGIELDENNEVNLNAFNKELFTDSYTNFKYYLTYQSGKYGVEDENGRVIIPLSRGFTKIYSYRDRYFECYNGSISGIFNIEGKEIIPLSIGATNIRKEECGGVPLFFVSKKIGEYNNIYGYYNLEGKAIVPLSLGFDYVMYDDEKRYIDVRKENKWGAYSLSGKVIVKPQYSSLSYTKDGFVGKKGEGFHQESKLGIYLPNHKSLFPPATKKVAVASKSSKTSSSTSQKSTSSTSQSSSSTNNKKTYGSNPVHGAILKKDNVQNSKTTVETTYYADGYVKTSSRTECTGCHGSGKCWNCGGTGKGLMGLNCPICFAGSGNCTYCQGSGVLVNITGSYQNDKGGTYSSSASSSSGSSSSGGTNSHTRSGRSSVYQKCKYCNGTGRCSTCNGKGVKFNSYSGHDDTCPGCNGSGKCRICYGTGRL